MKTHLRLFALILEPFGYLEGGSEVQCEKNPIVLLDHRFSSLMLNRQAGQLVPQPDSG